MVLHNVLYHKDDDELDDEEDEYFDCDDCGGLVKINQDDESKDFCDYCEKGLCRNCKKIHHKLKDENKCAFL